MEGSEVLSLFAERGWLTFLVVNKWRPFQRPPFGVRAWTSTNSSSLFLLRNGFRLQFSDFGAKVQTDPKERTWSKIWTWVSISYSSRRLFVLHQPTTFTAFPDSLFLILTFPIQEWSGKVLRLSKSFFLHLFFSPRWFRIRYLLVYIPLPTVHGSFIQCLPFFESVLFHIFYSIGFQYVYHESGRGRFDRRPHCDANQLCLRHNRWEINILVSLSILKSPIVMAFRDFIQHRFDSAKNGWIDFKFETPWKRSQVLKQFE